MIYTHNNEYDRFLGKKPDSENLGAIGFRSHVAGPQYLYCLFRSHSVQTNSLTSLFQTL